MHKNTKNLLDLLQDSLGVDNKRNLLHSLIKKKEQKLSLQEEFFEPSLKGNKSNNPFRNKASEDVVLTKIQNICYNMRKDDRSYDKAQLLELLANKLLEKKSSVLAVKVRQDHDQVSMIDNLNEVIQVTNPCKILNFLLAIQDTQPSNVNYKISDYGLSLLKNNITNKDFQIIKPDATEYHYSDTYLIDRNKSLNVNYPSFNNLTFENKSFLQQTSEQQSFKDQLSIKNRFNEAILQNSNDQLLNEAKDQDEDKPTFLFGALQRVQQNKNNLDNPFGIKFEIPPLPTLPNLGINQDIQAVQDVPNFFSFIKTPESQNRANQEQNNSNSNKINWISTNTKKNKINDSKSSPPYNRRQIKQRHKKSLTKKSLIWNLMPHLNESILSNNLQISSGISKLWEDEQLDIKLRDLRVSESGLITQQKMKEFNKDYLLCTEDQLNLYEKKIYTEAEVIQMTLLMLQGVPSQLFLLRNEKLTFFMRQNFEIRGYSLNKEAIDSIFSSLLDCGSFFLHIREFTEYMSLSQNNGGMILQNFVLAISDFLTFYYNQINEIWKEVEQRRKYEDEKMFQIDHTNNKTSSQMTLLELCAHTSQLQNQIKLVATICFTQKFINDLEFQDDIMQIDEQDKSKKMQVQIYNHKNLREKFQFDIERIRSKIWLENFPKGAKLLSYLYRILLCCESDLQAVDLLRRLFEKAIQPLLSMINSFIFTGDFDDPYSEFFIEKLFRRGVSQNVLQLQDFLFKITSKPMEKVPIFLVEQVAIIFKAGSSLHLLRKQGNQLSTYQDSFAVKQYYDICASGINQISDVKLTFKQNYNQGFKFHNEDYNQMHLDFQIDHLRQNQELRSKHFENQTELLQQIEMAIVQQEEEIYYKQIVQIEEAKREYIQKREEEREKERQQKIEKQKAHQKLVQDQIEELQRRKDEEKQAKIRENEAIRKEQQEYEARKKAIEEDLKRQLMEALRENQKLGEVSKNQSGRDEEEFDKKIQQIIEEKKQNEDNQLIEMEPIQLIPSEQNIAQVQQHIDIEMKDENNIINPLNPDEASLLENPNEDNPLISIINDALLKAKINLDQSMIKEEIQDNIQNLQQNLENSQILNVEEIQFIQEDPQAIKDMSPEEKSTFIIEIFIKPLFEGVNKRIDEKNTIKKKRYTWNRIRKDEQIQKYQEQKNKWKYKEPTISIKNKLNNIFQEFQEQTNHSQQIQESIEPKRDIALPNNMLQLNQEQTVSNYQQTTYNVPVALALQQCVQSVVKDQYKLINKCLIHLMFRRLRLFKHLEALKQFYFCNQGDVISLFMSSVFNDDYESTVKENSLSFINGQFDLALRTSHPEKFTSQDTQNSLFQLDSISNFNMHILGENFEFQAINALGINQNQNFYFTAYNMQDYVKLIYKRKYPLDLVISDQCIEKYNSIFFFLIKLKRVNQILSQMWKYLSSSEFRRLPFRQYNKLRQVQLLRSRMYHFTSMLEQYALTEVIQASWQTFKNNLPHQTIFEDLIRLHNEFLDQVLMKCFIDKKDHRIMDQITKVFSFVLQLNKIVKMYGTDIVNQIDAINEVNLIQDQFEKYTYYLYQLVKHLASKGSFKELFLRLDFNGFYDKTKIQQQR